MPRSQAARTRSESLAASPTLKETAACLASSSVTSTRPFTPSDAQGDLRALTALMLLQLARFDARVGKGGVPVRLQEQDRRSPSS